MKMAAHQPNWIPWLPFFDKAEKADVLMMLDDVQFPKNNFVNRVRIRTSKGAEWLTIPVKNKGGKIKDCLMADDQGWREKAFKTLRQNYSRTSFWHEYKMTVEKLLAQDTADLVEFNMAWLRWLFEELGIKTKIVMQSDLGRSNAKASELLAQMTMAVDCDVYLSGLGARGYMNPEVFKKWGLKIEYQEFEHPVYKQVYKPFLYNMTVLDALFNVGPNMRFLIG